MTERWGWRREDKQERALERERETEKAMKRQTKSKKRNEGECR